MEYTFQPVGCSNEMLYFGSEMTLWNSGNSLIVIDSTTPGANVVWDFSGLDHWSSDRPDLHRTVVDPPGK